MSKIDKTPQYNTNLQTVKIQENDNNSSAQLTVSQQSITEKYTVYCRIAEK